MATEHRPSVRTTTDHPDVRGVLLAVAYAGGILATVAAATGAAAVLAGFTAGLGQFVLVAAGWLVVVSVSPEIARYGTKRLAEIEFAQHAPRSSKAVTAVVSSLLTR